MPVILKAMALGPGWRNKIWSAQEEQSQLRERIEAPAPASLPKGVGAYSAAVLAPKQLALFPRC